ncbi:type I-E CRISPR-associated protein Cas6/Cse3/CasE [Nocardia sp. SYP-A9097]|uniref:type I-E CRISPR-associated protein Cas6/Cse3/CasE n=1 Tax=Nocardia sp. SYP-A9097 TaxID=2663237 RepID=UPI00129B2041|nr:type I-E CRISPR-associated protein Cas6/Cse3/CasE [Nocardia sp. SYP-A9097]MRH93418.1 type I-E CRISPR-associated protein Cas6/Cse3/CasE [Nocardia sp. SYP-A9097]
MTYLSRIRINPLRRDSRDLLANPRAMRSTVLHGVPDHPLDERVLWRLDSDNPYRPMLFVLTRSKPDWTHLVETAGWPDADGEHAVVADYTPLLSRLSVGDRYAFRLTASPVQNTSTPTKPTAAQSERRARGDRRSFRIGHRTAAAQLGWFLERTQRWGFQIPDARMDTPAAGLQQHEDAVQVPGSEVRVIARNRHSFGKGDTEARARDDKSVVVHTATFEGQLEVTEVELFTQHLLQGIGPSKAYGCGLLTLAPLESH